ncbi:alpha/beta hydrolase [Pedobacter sp. AW1-32]|uniref:alpha/beta hydrolase n=1 Tax=Pedobacter sp. AW1-32 TaxID=3383026 RepID=UPI003FEFAF04
MKLKIFCLLLLTAFAQLSFAQNQAFNLGQVVKINSSILSETRILNIYLPEGYSPDSGKKYPVIYLLDGSANEDFIHITGLVQYLTMIEFMPKSIVVGIANIDRKRDFTFPTQIADDKKDYPTTGKSKHFIQFMENELQPFIQQNYKTTSTKTIIGQSLGGLLAAEILLKKPQLFNQYIIISPSFWWNNESLINDFQHTFKQPKVATKVFIAVGAEGKIMETDAKKFAETLESKKSQNLKIDFVPMPAENHLTILHNAVYNALKALNYQKP